MRILLLSDYSDGSGGVERILENFRSELRRLGHEVCWLSSSASSQHAPNADELCYGTTGRLRGLLQFANPSAALRLRRVIKEFKPDVVHIAMMLTQLSPAILPILKGVPTLYYAQWYRPICLTGTRVLPDRQPCQQPAGIACLQCLPLQTWLPLAAGLKLFQHWSTAFRLIVADSEHLHRELNQWGCRSTEVIHSAVEQRAERPPLKDPPLVAFAGRLVPEKGVHILLEAARQVPDTQFLIAGDGPQRQALQALAGANIEFTGHIGRSEMEARFARAWVQVVPSLWAEPFGIVAAEAQMRGTAVIASNDGGLKEIVIDGKTGLLIPPGDIPALTQALKQLLSNRKQAEAMGRAARLSAIARFGLETFANRFLDAYRSIL